MNLKQIGKKEEKNPHSRIRFSIFGELLDKQLNYYGLILLFAITIDLLNESWDRQTFWLSLHHHMQTDAAINSILCFFSISLLQTIHILVERKLSRRSLSLSSVSTPSWIYTFAYLPHLALWRQTSTRRKKCSLVKRRWYNVITWIHIYLLFCDFVWIFPFGYL